MISSEDLFYLLGNEEKYLLATGDGFDRDPRFAMDLTHLQMGSAPRKSH